MKKLIKSVAVVLCMVMLFMAVGCSNNVEKTADGITKLKYVIKLNSQKDLLTVEAAVNDYIRDKIGAEIEFVRVDSGSYNQKLKTMLASNEQFDLMYDAIGHGYVEHARNGALMPLDELIHEYAPETYALVPEALWEAAKVDGQIYGTMNYQIIGRKHGFVYDKALVEKYNFDAENAKTLQDIEPYLAAIKENEGPEWIPFGALNQGFWTTMLTQIGFDPIVSTTTPGMVRIDDPTNTVFNQFETKEFEDYCRTMSDFYKKDYIKKDAATITNAVDVLQMGKTGVIYNNIKPGGQTAASTRMGGKEVMQVVTAEAFANTDFAAATLTVIGKNCKDPVKAMKFIELCNTDKYLYNLLCFGIEGKHYNKVGENRVELIPDSGYNPNSAWMWGCQFNAYLLPDQDDNVWEETKALNESARVSNLMGFCFDNTNVKSEIAQCSAVVAEYMPALGTGVVNWETKLAEFRAKLKTAGVDNIIAEQSKQIKEWMAK